MRGAIWGERSGRDGHLCLGLLRQHPKDDQYPGSVWDIITSYTFDKHHDGVHREYEDTVHSFQQPFPAHHYDAEDPDRLQPTCASCGALEMISPHQFITGRSFDGLSKRTQNFCSMYSMLADGYNFAYEHDEERMTQHPKLDQEFLLPPSTIARTMAIADRGMQNYWRLRQRQLKNKEIEAIGAVGKIARLEIFWNCHLYEDYEDPDQSMETENKTFFHRNFSQTIEEIEKSCWWPKMSKQIKFVMEDCENCYPRDHAGKKRHHSEIELGKQESPLEIE